MQRSTSSRLVSRLAALFLLSGVALAQTPANAALDTAKLRKEAQAAVQAGDFEKAAAGFRKVTEADPKDGLAWQLLGYSLHAAGKLDEALPVHEKATEFPKVAPVAAYNAACVHALQGRPDDAFRWLDKAVGFGFDRPDQIADDSDLDSLRKDPRFAKVTAAIEAKAKAMSGGGGVQAYVQTVARRNSRIAWFGAKGSPGQLSIDYSPVPWQAKYETALQGGKFLGKKWRLGSDFWTRLDTSVDLQFGAVKVPAGYYYLTAEQRDANTYILALHDAGAVKKLHLDAFAAEKLVGGIEVPMQHAAADKESAELEISLATDEGSTDHGSLVIRFGGHVLSAPVLANLGK